MNDICCPFIPEILLLSVYSDNDQGKGIVFFLWIFEKDFHKIYNSKETKKIRLETEPLFP